MERVFFNDNLSYNNILYIGDEARDCLKIIEKFNLRLHEIEERYTGWFSDGAGQPPVYDKLQRHIQYHFEGGIAIFKFKNEEDIPSFIRQECLVACRNLAFEQLFCAS